MKGMFDLIIFDLDGTLVDSIDWIVHCLKKSAEINGCKIPEENVAKDTIGLSIHEAMATLFPGTDKKIQEQLVASYSQEFFSQQITGSNLFVGIKDMLKVFKNSGYKLAIATGKSRKGLDWAMQGTGLTDFFVITRCADETLPKPHPDMLEEIMQEMQVSIDRSVMIGDSIHDMEMAKNAKIKAIAVSCGANSHDQLKTYSPLLILEETTELLQFL